MPAIMRLSSRQLTLSSSGTEAPVLVASRDSVSPLRTVKAIQPGGALQSGAASTSTTTSAVGLGGMRVAVGVEVGVVVGTAWVGGGEVGVAVSKRTATTTGVVGEGSGAGKRTCRLSLTASISARITVSTTPSVRIRPERNEGAVDSTYPPVCGCPASGSV
jgi:hypothetical protein